jgi:hypothetical protein
MSNNSPGFSMASNMMNNMGNMGNMEQGPSRNMGPPPAPLESRTLPNQRRPGQEVPQNRPDISMARGTMFRESALEMKQNYADVNAPSKPLNIPEKRPEMRGPSTDINNILSGLKTRTVDMRPTSNEIDNVSLSGDLDDSLISVSSMKDMQNMNVPKRAGRRAKNVSDKNTIALDI